MPPFSANVGPNPPTTVFIHGEIDISTAPMLKDCVIGVLRKHPDELTLDLTEVNFMDCAGISVISYVLRDSPDGFQVVLRHPQPMPRMILELTGMGGLCSIED
jgi:anti-anti-sigma factor